MKAPLDLALAPGIFLIKTIFGKIDNYVVWAGLLSCAVLFLVGYIMSARMQKSMFIALLTYVGICLSLRRPYVCNWPTLVYVDMHLVVKDR